MIRVTLKSTACWSPWSRYYSYFPTFFLSKLRRLCYQKLLNHWANITRFTVLIWPLGLWANTRLVCTHLNVYMFHDEFNNLIIILQKKANEQTEKKKKNPFTCHLRWLNVCIAILTPPYLDYLRQMFINKLGRNR